MDIKKFKFPELSICMPVDKSLLVEAKQREFYNGYTPYNKLFNELFFDGGKLNFKKDLDKNFKTSAVPYLKAFMGSYEPKHEEKEAVCALLLSELVDT